MRPAVRRPGRRRRRPTDSSKARTPPLPRESMSLSGQVRHRRRRPSRHPRSTIKNSHSASCRCRASRRRTTHVVDSLPERVRLVAAPGELRDVGRGARVEDRGREVALCCRLIDGSAGTIPARWIDVSRRAAEERPLGTRASPAGWRLLAERLEALRSRRPARGRACVQNGGDRVGTARALGERGDAGGCGGVGALPPERQREMRSRLARLLARLVVAERDE